MRDIITDSGGGSDSTKEMRFLTHDGLLRFLTVRLALSMPLSFVTEHYLNGNVIATIL